MARPVWAALSLSFFICKTSNVLPHSRMTARGHQRDTQKVVSLIQKIWWRGGGEFDSGEALDIQKHADPLSLSSEAKTRSDRAAAHRSVLVGSTASLRRVFLPSLC